MKSGIGLLFSLVLAFALAAGGVFAKEEVSSRFPFSGVNVATITATTTLTNGSAPVQRYTVSGGNVNVVLPSEASSQGKYFWLGNVGASNNAVVKASDGSTTVVTVTPGMYGFVHCDGTTWRGSVIPTSSVSALTVTTLSATDIDAGASGTAGTVDIYPTTASKGKVQFTVSDQTGNTTIANNFAAMGQATTLTVPDPGASSASYVLTAGSQTLTGKTLTTPTLTAPVFGSSPTGDGITQWAEVALTAAEIKALRATPKTLVAAPGSGKVLEFVSAMLLLDYGTTQFAEDGGGSNLGVRYTNGSGVQVSEDIEMTGFITQNADYMTATQAKKDPITAKTGCENQALVLHNIGAGEIVTGDSVIRVKVAYRVWSTGF